MKLIPEAKKKKKEELQSHPDEYGSPLKEENRIPLSKLPNNSKIRKIYYAIDRLQEGIPRKVVEKMIQEEFNHSSTSEAEDPVKIAMTIIAEQYFSESELVISLHVQRYNRDINKHLKKTFDSFNAATKRKLQIQNYMEILDLLHAKESLLQLHNKNTIIRINQTNTFIKQTKDSFLETLNLEKLSLDEKIELLNLIQKTKGIESIEGVRLREKEEVTEEIEFEEIKEERPNVELITLEDKQKEKEDSTPKPLTLLDLREKFRRQLQENAKIEFKKAGSKDGNL